MLAAGARRVAARNNELRQRCARCIMWSSWPKKLGFRFQRSSLCTPGLAMYVPYRTYMRIRISSQWGRDQRLRVAPLKHVSYFWRNPKLALSLSEQTFLLETRRLGLLETFVLGNVRCARL